MEIYAIEKNKQGKEDKKGQSCSLNSMVKEGLTLGDIRART